MAVSQWARGDINASYSPRRARSELVAGCYGPLVAPYRTCIANAIVPWTHCACKLQHTGRPMAPAGTIQRHAGWPPRTEWAQGSFVLHMAWVLQMDLSNNIKLVFCLHIDGLMQKRCNSIALAMEIHLFCIKPSMQSITKKYNLYCNCWYSFWKLS